jgi:hypothetical protein
MAKVEIAAEEKLAKEKEDKAAAEKAVSDAKAKVERDAAEAKAKIEEETAKAKKVLL